VDDSAVLAVGPCVVHGGVFSFDPDRVPYVMIDPVTDRPPDVGPDGQPCEPSPEALARAYQLPLCPGCAKALNRVLTADGLEPRFDETDTAAGG
jgi:hypothetical protein